MSGDKGEFKGKARSSSQVGPNIPAKVSIRWYGMWKRNSKHISDFINNRTLTHPKYDKTLKSLLGSKEIEINFEEGAAADFELPRKVIPDVKSHSKPNIMYVFYDAGDGPSFEAAKKFIKEQCNAPASNPSEKTARKNICLIADSSKSHHRGAVDWAEGELVKNLWDIQFYQCSSANSMQEITIQEIITKSLEEYAISVLSPEEGKKITAAKKVMENVYKDIVRLKQPPTHSLSPQELLGILKELAAIKESIENSKAYYLDDTGQKFVERELPKLESYILERVRWAVEAGGPTCPSELYHLYVERGGESRYWENQVADCLKVIEESQNEFLAQSKSDAKISAYENVKKADAAYERFGKIIAKLQTIANNCASSPKGFRRGSQADAIKETVGKIKERQDICEKMLSDFLSAAGDKIAADVVGKVVNSIREPGKADFKDLEKCNNFRKICQFFRQVIPHPGPSYLGYVEGTPEGKLLKAISLSLRMLDDESLKKSYDEHLQGASRSLKELSEFCVKVNALKNLTMQEILIMRPDILELGSKFEWIKNKINKYKLLYDDQGERSVEEEFVAVEADVKKLIDKLDYTEKALKSQEILTKSAEDLSEIETIEKRFSALTTLDEILQLLDEAKIFERKILEIQHRVEDHRRLYGNVGLEAITANLAKTETSLQAVSDSLRQIMVFGDRLMIMIATQKSLQPLSDEPTLEEISKFIDKAEETVKNLSSMKEELENWSLAGKGSPLYLQLQKTLEGLKGGASKAIAAAKIKFMALSYTKLLKTLGEVSEAKELEEQCKKISQAEQLKNGLAGLQITDISNKDVLPKMLGKAKEKIVETVEALIFPHATLLNELNGKVAEASTMEECCKIFDQMEEVGKNLIKIQQASPETANLAGMPACLEQKEKIIGQLTEKMKKLVKAKYGGVLNDSIIKVSTIDGCYQAINQIRKVKKELEAFQQQYSAVSELMGIPNYLKQAETLIVQLLENIKGAVRAEYMSKCGDMSEVFRSHGSGEIMTTPILYDNGYSYNKDDKPKADESEIKQVARNRPLESLLNLYKPKKIESGTSEDKPAGSGESKAISFDQAVYFITCPLEAAIIRKPIMAIIINGEEREGRVYENSKQALGLKVETETGAEIVDRFHGNHALESFTKVLFEQYPDELESLLKNDWGVNKENAVEIVKWLVSLRIDFATKETYIASVYEKSGLTAEQLGRECGRVQDAVGQSAVSTVHDRLVLLINIQKDELPYLGRLVAQAKQAGRSEGNLNNIKEGEIIIEFLTSNVDRQIRDIILDNAARYQTAVPLQVSPPKDDGQQAPSSVSSSLFYHLGSKEDDKSVALQHSGDGQQIPATVSSSHVTTFSGSNVAPPLPAGDSSHFSSSTDQLPAGNSLNN